MYKYAYDVRIYTAQSLYNVLLFLFLDIWLPLHHNDQFKSCKMHTCSDARNRAGIVSALRAKGKRLQTRRQYILDMGTHEHTFLGCFHSVLMLVCI